MQLLAIVALVSFREAERISAMGKPSVKACKCLDEMSTMCPLVSDALNANLGRLRRAAMSAPEYLRSLFVSATRIEMRG